MKMIYYKTNTTFMEITEVEVDEVTEHFVSIKGNRSKKITSYECYFETKEDAKQYIINHYQNIISGLADRLEYATKKLNQAFQL